MSISCDNILLSFKKTVIKYLLLFTFSVCDIYSYVTTMKMIVSPSMTMTPRLHHRRLLRLGGAGKRPTTHQITRPGKGQRPTPQPATCPVRSSMDTGCDNSDDSGLGFDNPMDIHAVQYTERTNNWVDDIRDYKRRKLELKLEHDETNDNYCFPETIKTCKDNSTIIRTIPNTGIQNISRATNGTTGKTISRCLPLTRKSLVTNGPVTLASQLNSSSRNGKVQLQIISQPEQQHRARYQTEGSRGAVKDRSGNSFPIVKLVGYDKPATLQVFIGTDQGRVAPHMFYQACRVSGKNSTPCSEKKIEGTIIIEVELECTKEMVATCDCVGILKERNVDVEHRFPEQIGSRNKKKSTRCRMVFRTSITNDDGSTEVLQVCSQPIVCTQPPGIPEICKKSLTSCPASGGLELFILGKNFLKDTRVVFQQAEGSRDSNIVWEEYVVPDKEFLQQTHLVCVVPSYMQQDITEPVTVRLYVISSGKNSEPHSFVFTPISSPSVIMENHSSDRFLSKMVWNNTQKQDVNINMMPPRTTLVPVAQRRPSTLIDNHSPPMRSLKTELLDENSQNSMMDHMLNENSVDSIRRFRPINENSQETNENSNENLNFHCDTSNESTSHSPRDRMLGFQNIIQPEIPTTIKSGLDLRLKAPVTTISDLADTQPPSMATLLKFGVTEQTNIPLPTQTGQSVENFFLTTLENPVNKPVLSDSIVSVKVAPKSNETKVDNLNQRTLNQLLSTEQNVQGTKIFNNNQGINETIVRKELIPINESHIVNNGQSVFPNNLKPQTEVLKNNDIINQLSNTRLPPTTQNDVIKTDNLILAEQSLQAISTNMLASNKNGPNLLLTQSLQNITQSEQILTQQLTNTVLPTATQKPMKQDTGLILSQQNLVAKLLPTATLKLDELVNSTVESHIRSPPQEILSTATELRQSPILHSPKIIINNTHPDVLLNTQTPMLSSAISPGNDLLIRSTQNDIPQDVILNPQVAPSVICSDALLGSNLNTICTPGSLENCLQTSSITECISETNLIQNHILNVSEISPKIVSEIAAPILNMFENNNQSAMIIKDLIIPQRLVLEKQESDTSKRLAETRQGCPDMITPAITNMSENDLIHYINPQMF